MDEIENTDGLVIPLVPPVDGLPNINPDTLGIMAAQVAEIHAALTAIAELVEKVGPALENSPIMSMLGIKL